MGARIRSTLSAGLIFVWKLTMHDYFIAYRLSSTHLRPWLYSALLAASLTFAQGAPAPTRGLETVLLENKWAKITQADFDAELLRLPPDLRGGFTTNPQRIYALLA